MFRFIIDSNAHSVNAVHVFIADFASGAHAFGKSLADKTQNCDFFSFTVEKKRFFDHVEHGISELLLNSV